MCTVTWVATRDRERGPRFVLWHNRDERHGRAPERGPRPETLEGTRVLAPADGDHGGTWITVNEHGVALCILNGYLPADASTPGRDRRSRGLLVRDLAPSADLAELEARAAGIELERYASFHLIGLAPDGAPRAFDWDGVDARWRILDDAARPLVSSSWQPETVRPHRRDVLRAALDGADGPAQVEQALEAFHASHVGGPGPLSVCMHRDDAATRSTTRVRVGAAGVELAHRSGAPCAGGPWEVATLPLRGAPSEEGASR